MTTIPQIIETLRNLTNAKITQAEIARALEITNGTVSIRVKTNSELSLEELRKIGKYFDVNLLLHLPIKQLSKLHQRNEEIQKEPTSEDCISIPVRGNITASMGNGIEVYDESETGSYYVSRKLIKDVGANIKETDFIPCEGDSMYPTIEGGSLLMVDKSNREVFDGKIYCIRLNNQLMAKRLQFLPPNTVRVISDNQKYKPFEVDMNQALNFDFEIIGQIKWYGTVTR